MPATLFGIGNCDTVRRARAWMSGQGVGVAFHDFKKAGVPGAHLDRWLDAAGWERLLNRKGTAWRQLDEGVRAKVVDTASARAVMLAHPSTIKRPVVEWDGAHVTVGFDPAEWTARIAALGSPR